MRLFTIGFTKKTGEEFFTRLQKAHVKRVVDVRLNNTSQLAGFAKGRDLGYFLAAIAKIDYVHYMTGASQESIWTPVNGSVL
ncbi:MAG: DUF488 domain-containing protein [Planctomycetes bacterium]|nr:DUF488 domain-containing protein [Planctomycetota bacterium]